MKVRKILLLLVTDKGNIEQYLSMSKPLKIQTSIVSHAWQKLQASTLEEEPPIYIPSDGRLGGWLLLKL